MDISWLRKRNNESICQTLKTVTFSAQISYSGVQMSETTSENASFFAFLYFNKNCHYKLYYQHSKFRPKVDLKTLHSFCVKAAHYSSTKLKCHQSFKILKLCLFSDYWVPVSQCCLRLGPFCVQQAFVNRMDSESSPISTFKCIIVTTAWTEASFPLWLPMTDLYIGVWC